MSAGSVLEKKNYLNNPVFFSQIKHPNSDFISLNCITAFSIPDDDMSSIVFNQSLVSSLLQENPNIHEMEFLSVLFGFNDLMCSVIDVKNIVLVARKLFSIGFFAPQILKSNSFSFIDEVEILINSIISAYSSRKDICGICTSSVGYILSQISPKMKELNVEMECFSYFTKIIQQAQILFRLSSSYADNSMSYFQEFFMNLLYCFKSDTNLNESNTILFTESIKILSDTISLPPVITYNYIALIDHMLKLLPHDITSSIPINISIPLYILLSKIPTKFGPSISFLLDEHSIYLITKYIKYCLRSMSIHSDNTKNPTILNEKYTPKNVLESDLVELNFFNSILSETVLYKIDTPSGITPSTKMFDKYPEINLIIQATLNLCRHGGQESTISFLRFSLNDSQENSVSFLTFLVLIIRSYISSGFQQSIGSLSESGIFDTILKMAFRSPMNDELCNFVGDVIVFSLSHSDSCYPFVKILFELYEDLLSGFGKSNCLNRIICHVTTIFPNYICELFKDQYFDQRIANLLLFLQNSHFLAHHFNNLDQKQRIEKTRIDLLSLINVFTATSIVRDFFLTSEVFIDSLIRHSYELGISKISFLIISNALSYCDSKSLFMEKIFSHFNHLLLQFKNGKLSYHFLNQLILVILNSEFENNSVELATMLINNQFAELLVKCVITSSDTSDMFYLLSLASKLSRMKGLFREFMSDIDMFQMIMPTIKKIYNQNGESSIINHLWSIVFESNVTPDKKRSIKNASALSLIFELLKNNIKLLGDFLVYIDECCEFDPHSALEVNNSDFPTILINEIISYRNLDYIPEVFAPMIRLFSFLSQYSIKVKDIILLFQSLTLTQNQTRPIWTEDILKSILLIFQTPYDAPSSFFCLKGKESSLIVPKIDIAGTISSFSFFIDIELVGDPNGDLFRIEFGDNRNTLVISLHDKNILFSISQEKINSNGSFDYSFPLNSWIRLCITYSNSQMSLYVHGKKQGAIVVPKLMISGTIDSCLIASGLKSNIGLFGFMKICLPEALIKLLSSFPRTQVTSFLPPESYDYPDAFSPLFDGKISNNLLFMYSASVSKINTCPNLSYVYQKEIPLDTKGCLLFGYSPPAKEILGSIGGAINFLPLFGNLDSPIKNPSGSFQENHSSFLPFVLMVLDSVLSGSEMFQKRFYEISGFSIISSLLSRSRLFHINSHILVLLKRMFNNISYAPLLIHMIDSVFLDVRLWIYLPISMQLGFYDTMIDCINKMDFAQMRDLFKIVTFQRIIFTIKTCFWDSFSSKTLCLFDRPKLDPVTKIIEAERPSDLSNSRGKLWELATLLVENAFSSSASNALLFFATDVSDPNLACETLFFLIKMLKRENSQFISSLSKEISFELFFPLLLSSDIRYPILCLHVLLSFYNIDLKYNCSFLSPYCFMDWIGLICLVLTPQVISVEFSNVIFGYLCGYHFADDLTPPSPEELLKNGKYEGEPKLLSLAIMSIAHMNTSQSIVYFQILQTAVLYNPCYLANSDDYFICLLQYLVSQNCSPQKFDVSSKLCLEILVTMLYANLQKGISDIEKVPIFIELLNYRTNNDYSHICRSVFIEFLDYYCKSDSYKQTEKILCESVRVIFMYLFAISSNSPFFDPFNGKSKENTKMTYQELSQIKIGGEYPDLRFIYGTRSKPDGTWLDYEIADALLGTISKTGSIFSLKWGLFYSKSIDIYLHYAFVLSIGLQHSPHFSVFMKHIRPLTNQIPTDGKTSDSQIKSFLSYMAGLIRVYMQTDRSHASHIYLQEDTAAFNKILQKELKQKIKWGNSIDSFDSCFKSRGYHFAHIIIEMFSGIENEISDMVIEFEKYVPKLLNSLLNLNTKITQNFHTLNSMGKSPLLNKKRQQIQGQLIQFVATMRNKHSNSLKSYRLLFNELCSEKGPWSPPEMIYNYHWKLDTIYQESLRRGRMKINKKFKDHKDASLLRDVGNVQNVQALYQDHLKKNRISSFGSDSSFVFSVLDDEEPINDINQNDENLGVIMKIEAKLVTISRVYSGSLLITRDSIIFDSIEQSKYVKIENSKITHIFFRRYLLLDTSIEIFSKSKKSVFFDLVEGQRMPFVKLLKKLSLPSISFLQMNSSDIIQLVQTATEKWCSGEMNNFDYLMSLNLYSGRTYNDLSQYPVFPWVLSDYTSIELDLSSQNSYRDLSLPIGVLNPERLSVMEERMNSSEEDSKYLYSSFYSSSAVVLGFLIRVEPFTSLHIELQSGRFDISDRLFHSIPRAWESVKNTPMDFRELTPEFYYFPDFLVNSNEYDLGKVAKAHGDVELPPWASSPYDFIRKNRAALESPIAAEKLPRWIDLIFGCTSRGSGAVSVNNMYNPNFFDEIITPTIRKDQTMCKFIQEYAACFGMAPKQIFSEPHKSKKYTIIDFYPSHKYTMIAQSNNSIISIEYSRTTITSISSSFEVLRIDPNTYESQSFCLPRNCEIQPSETYKYSQLCQSSNNFIISSTPWDTSIMLFRIQNSLQTLYNKRPHSRRISSTAISSSFFASASNDCTMMLWRLENKSPQVPHYVLTKHNSPIQCINLNESLDISVSCSSSGLIITTSLISGQFLRSKQTCNGKPLCVSTTNSGLIIIGYQKSINVFDQNLNDIGSFSFENRDVSFCKGINWGNGVDYVFLAFKSKQLLILSIPEFKIIWEEDSTDFVVTSCDFSQHPRRELVIGTMCGKIIQLSIE